MAIFFVIVTALILDHYLGEPRRLHPLVGFGNCANYLERIANRNTQQTISILIGLLCLSGLVLPWVALSILLSGLMNDVYWLLDIVIVYWAIGLRSLQDHIKPIQSALLNNDIKLARQQLARTVSRDTQQLDRQQITRATIETTLENGNDAVFGVLFCYAIGGAPLVIAYRLINTLDAMWGYRTDRFEYFGKAAARLDDLLNFIPARLTAISYSVCGNFLAGIRSWRQYAKQLASPNAGPVMAAGAGSLNIELGGDAYYHQKLLSKPVYGGSQKPDTDSIEQALKLVQHSVILCCGLLFFVLGIAELLISYE